jgi:hypothetical protein
MLAAMVWRSLCLSRTSTEQDMFLSVSLVTQQLTRTHNTGYVALNMKI